MTLRQPGSVLLISCYELGHQPLGAAGPFGFLKRAGFAPDTLDISVDPFDDAKVERARFVGISVPMHTALRLGVRVAQRVREINPAATICCYGLYAALNADYLLEHGVDFCIGGECEAPLVALAEALESKNGNGHGQGVAVDGVIQRGAPVRPYLQRLSFALPMRDTLPPLDKYARLEHKGERRVVGYTEASRGCLHLCTHCPIPPVYGGRFFVVPENIVLEDIRNQVRAGATHITFGDPDFLNGPGHALSVVRAMHTEFPDLTFDVTTKVEHILKRGDVLPEMGRLGCLFLISAVESVSDTVLAILEKNHTKADIEEAIKVVRAAGIAPRPTWVAFTPWTTLGDYLDMLAFIEANGLIDHVDPVQYTIRLLIPPGSYLLNRPEMKAHLGKLNQASFSYVWAHPDPGMDRLQKKMSALVEKDVQAGVDPATTFYRVWSLAAGRDPVTVVPVLPPDRERAPRLSEPWFCWAEPTEGQLDPLQSNKAKAMLPAVWGSELPYQIQYSLAAEEHLRALTARQRSTALDTIDEQLAHQPGIETRNRKPMRPNPLAPWELRIDELRVYYDIAEEPEQRVTILAVGIKDRNRVLIGGEEIELWKSLKERTRQAASPTMPRTLTKGPSSWRTRESRWLPSCRSRMPTWKRPPWAPIGSSSSWSSARGQEFALKAAFRAKKFAGG